MKKRVAIIGGGISGLTAAYILQRDHAETCEFTLFEASNRFGGIIETVRTEGFTIECGPDSWVTEKPWAERLARELGLAGELLPSNDHQRRTYIARGGVLTPLPDAMRLMVPTDLDAVLRSPLFSDAARQAYRSEPLRAAELRASALQSRNADESVATFVERHFGAEVVDAVAGPLLAGVFGGDTHKLSARALLGSFVTMEAEHGSLITGMQQRIAATVPVFTTLSSGLGTLVDRLLQHLPQTSVLRATPVRRLEQLSAGWAVDSEAGRSRFDGVLIAASLDATRRLLGDIPLAGLQQAAGLLPTEASSCLIVALGYTADTAPKPAVPTGFGLLVALEGAEDSDLLACTFLHQKFAQRAPHGATLLRAFFGRTAADRLGSLSDRQIAVVARDRLARLLGPLPEQADVALVRHWPHSLPQYEVGHIDRIAQFDGCIAAIPGLAVIGNALRGVGLSDLVREAIQAAQALAQP